MPVLARRRVPFAVQWARDAHRVRDTDILVAFPTATLTKAALIRTLKNPAFCHKEGHMWVVEADVLAKHNLDLPLPPPEKEVDPSQLTLPALVANSSA
jgi:hypothetical protein